MSFYKKPKQKSRKSHNLKVKYKLHSKRYKSIHHPRKTSKLQNTVTNVIINPNQNFPLIKISQDHDKIKTQIYNTNKRIDELEIGLNDNQYNNESGECDNEENTKIIQSIIEKEINSLKKSIHQIGDEMGIINQKNKSKNESINALKGQISKIENSEKMKNQLLKIIDKSSLKFDTELQKLTDESKKTVDILNKKSKELKTLENLINEKVLQDGKLSEKRKLEFNQRLDKLKTKFDTQIENLKSENKNIRIHESINKSNVLDTTSRMISDTNKELGDKYSQLCNQMNSDIDEIKSNFELEMNKIRNQFKSGYVTVSDFINESNKIKAQIDDSVKESVKESAKETINESKQMIKQSMSEAKTNMNNLKSEFESKIQSVGEKTSHISELEEKMSHMIKEFKEEYELLKNQQNTAKTQFNNLVSELKSEIQKSNEMTEGSETQLRLSINTLKNHLSQKVEEIKELETRMDFINEKFDDNVNELEEKYSNLSNEVINNINPVIELSKKDLDAMRKNMETLDNTCVKSELFNTEINRIHKNHQDHEKLTEIFSSQIENKVHDIEALISKMEKKSNVNFENNKNTTEKLYESIEELKTNMENQANSLLKISESKLAEGISTFQHQLEEFKTDVNSKIDDKIDKIESDQHLRESIKKVKTEFNSLIENNIQSVKSSIDKLESEYKSDHNSVKESIDNNNTTIHEIKEENKIFKKEYAAEYNDQYNQIKEVQNELKSASSVWNESSHKITEDVRILKESLQKESESKSEILQKLIDVSKELESKINSVKSEKDKIDKRTQEMSELQQHLEEKCSIIETNFNDKYAKIGKRYNQLHTILLSNMEEFEKESQNVNEIVDLHEKIKSEYKSMMNTYDTQHEDYKKSLKEKDDKLNSLELQVKNQLEEVERRISHMNTNSEPLNKPTRIDELAVPKHITHKKV